jgi:hypothetical protein
MCVNACTENALTKEMIFFVLRTFSHGITMPLVPHGHFFASRPAGDLSQGETTL